MRISELTISGFRCFDDDGESIKIGNFSCFVGPNSSGKTAAMVALTRLFGSTGDERRIRPTDFHLEPGEKLGDKRSRELHLECVLTFPELESDDGNRAAVPETFNQMVVDSPGGTPFCRLRLEATWTADGTPTGDVEQTLSWILTDSDDPEVIDDGNRRKVQPDARARIRAVYVPAARDVPEQLASAPGSALGKLLSGLAWDDEEEALRAALSDIQERLDGISGIESINSIVHSSWVGLYAGRVARHFSLRAVEKDPTELLKLLAPTFHPGEDERRMSASELSDGLRSLFSLSLALGAFEVERHVRETGEDSGFCAALAEELPLLTVFLVEEPENHLSPHYLGRVVNRLRSVSRQDDAHVIVSSHSPSILGRVRPSDVRYFLGHEHTRSTQVSRIRLPRDRDDESFKYVREAVRGHPELYFSRLVVLGEGPSEEIVLRRLFEVFGSPLDSSFVSVVPLAGRHVNHFWRLLHSLKIPHLTLLDLDREKEGGGWGRIQYVRDQLVARYGAGHQELKFDDEGDESSLDSPEWDNLKENDVNDVENMESWISLFQESYDVYFSVPLDLDFSLLEAFPELYTSQAEQGPRLPDEDGPEYADALQRRIGQVLSSSHGDESSGELGSTFTAEQRKLLPWYKYLFVDGSKPVAHMRAMTQASPAQLQSNIPQSLKCLLRRAQELISSDAD